MFMSVSKPWILKYMPKAVSDVRGQDNAVSQLVEFVLDYKKQKKKAALIYGPTGSGKTSCVYAIANDHNLEVVEVNASDFRNKDQINSLLGNAMKQMSLFSKGKIILVDEIEGLSGTKDRGGLQAVIRLLENSSFPVILTSNNPWDAKFSKVRTKSIMIEFEIISHKDIVSVLSGIAEKENIRFTDSDISVIARHSAGDLRAAINDLQILSFAGKIDKLKIEELSEREKEDSIINALLKILKTTDPKIAVSAFDNVKEDFDQRFLWIDENLPKEYTYPKDLARAYECISKADIYRRRIRRWQHWRFLVYINILLTAGIATSKNEKYKKFVKYSQTQRLLKIWRANMRYNKRNAIAEKIALATHTSKSRVLNDTLPYIKQVFMQKNVKSKDIAKSLAEHFELDKDEIRWLEK